MGYITNQSDEQRVPLELEDELRKNPKVHGIFWSLSPSHKLEYINWINEAKKEKTRSERAKKAVLMMLENNQG